MEVVNSLLSVVDTSFGFSISIIRLDPTAVQQEALFPPLLILNFIIYNKQYYDHRHLAKNLQSVLYPLNT